MIKVIHKSILNSEKDIIVQQVNCIGKMGKGLVVQIKRKYPNVYKEYIDICNRYKPNELIGKVLLVKTEDGYVANIFGQKEIAKSKYNETVYTDTNALIQGIIKVRELAIKNNLSVAIPTHIGCGLANGNWEEIKPLIEDVFDGWSINVKFYHYRGE